MTTTAPTKTEVYYDIEHTALPSSALYGAYYDNLNEHLYVEFWSGQVAGYQGVPAAMFNQLVTANSIGKYYQKYIKGMFQGLNGDVALVERPHPQHHNAKAVDNFVVTVKVNGTFKVAVEATDLGDAASKISKIFCKNLVDGSCTLTSVETV